MSLDKELVDIKITTMEPKADIYSVGKKPDSAPIKGYDFNSGVNYQQILESFATTGLQATNLSNAINILNEAIKWRLSD